MDLNRRAVLFSMIALMMASLFVIIFSTEVRTARDFENPLIETRVRGMSVFTNSVELYMEQMAVMSASRSLDGLIDVVRYTDDFTIRSDAELQCFFRHMFENATLLSEEISGEEVNKFLQAEIYNGSPDTIYDAYDSVPCVGATTETTLSPGESAFQPFKPDAAIINPVVRNFRFAKIDTTLDETTVHVEILRDGCPISQGNKFIAVAQDTNNYNIDLTRVPLDSDTEYVIRVYADKPIEVELCDGGSAPEATGPLRYGTLRPNESMSYPPLLNYTFNILTEELENLSEEQLNIDTDINLTGILVEQIEPWTVDVVMNITITSEDNYSLYKKNYTTTVLVPISGKFDPLFLYYNRTMDGVGGNLYGFNRTISYNPVLKDTDFDIIVFSDMVRNESYKSAKGWGMSFLDRLTNTSQESACCGIASVISPGDIPPDPEFDAIRNRTNTSYLDWHFFENRTFECGRLWEIRYDDPTALEKIWYAEYESPPGTINVYPTTGFYNMTKFPNTDLVRFGVSNDYWHSPDCP